MIQYPITLAMLSQDYFRQNGYPYGWELPDTSTEHIPEPDVPLTRHQKVRQSITNFVQRVKARWNNRLFS